MQVVVESDKADMDVESFNDGILGAIVINEGGVANVGDPIAYIAESEADLESAKSKAGHSGAAGNGAAPAEVRADLTAGTCSQPACRTGALPCIVPHVLCDEYRDSRKLSRCTEQGAVITFT